MYKVLLAEDEIEVLNSMIENIAWKEFGFEKPLGCENGVKAIELIKSGFVPNLVITDICMPFADGLKFTKYISEHLPDTMVVILTGYDEFKYAHTAIKLKVYDYILKPVTPSQMRELLSKLKKVLDEKELVNSEYSLNIFSSYYLNKLISKKLDNVLVNKFCNTNKNLFKGEYHLVSVLDIDCSIPETVKENNNLELKRYALFNISYEMAQKYNQITVFQGNDGLTDMILSADNIESVYAVSKKLCSEICKTVKTNLEITASAGIGKPVHNVVDLYLSRRKAGTALSYRFFYGNSSIISAADIDLKKSKNDINYYECENLFVKAVKDINKDAAMSAISDFVLNMKENRVSFEKCIFYSQKLIMCMISLTNDVTNELEAKSLEKISDNTDFFSVSNLIELEKLLKNICLKAFKIFKDMKNSTVVSQVVKAEKYIKENYSDPELSLNTLTEHLAISTSYFSAIFKSQTNSTFIEYLTHVRMEKAKQILAFTDQRTYEAAENVGFSDPHYFSVAFKRVTGMTPTEYRERTKKHDA